MPPSQPNVSANGARNLGLAQAVKFAAYLLGLVLLSRILGPEAFGVVAIATAFVGFAEYFRDLGLSVAAIREKELPDSYRDGLLWTNVAIGSVLATAMWASAPLIAGVFDIPLLAPVLQWLSPTFLINAFGAQYRAGLNREQRFTPLALADSIGPVVGLALALAFALSGFGIASLVAQLLGTALVSTVILMVSGRWLPGRPRRAPGIGRLYAFGANYAASQLIGYAGNNVDTVALGISSTPAAVGVYSRSFQLVIGVLDQIKSPAMTVALPALSHIRESRDELVAFLKKGQMLLAYLTIPAAAVMFATSVPLVAVVLGPEWSTAGEVVAILAVAGALQQLATVASWLFVTSGHAAALRNYMTVSTALKVAIVLIVAPYGAAAVAMGYSAAIALAWPIAILWSCRAAGLAGGPILLQGVRLFFGGGVAAAAGRLMCELATSGGPWLALIAGVLGVVGGYALLMALPAFRRDLFAVAAAVRLAFPRKMP